MLSTYALRPVACDKEPWRISHTNKFNEYSKRGGTNRGRGRGWNSQFTIEGREDYIKVPKNMTHEE